MDNLKHLMSAVKKGDLVAFEKLIVMRSAKIEALFRSQMACFPNHYEMEDCLQEFWIKVWDQRLRFDPQKGCANWLQSIARNLLIDWIRKQKWEQDELNDIISLQNSAHQKLLGKEMEQRCLEILPQKQKLVFILCMSMGLSPKEAADLAGMNRSTLRNQLTHVRQKLKQALLDLGFSNPRP